MRPRYLIALVSLVAAFAAPSFSNAATLTFSTPNCSDFTVTSNNGNVTLNCVPANSGGSGAPSSCSLNASTTSLGAGGGNVTLTASCGGGGAPTTYSWTGGNAAASTSSGSQTVNVTSTTTFSVTPSNGSGNGNTAQVTVNVGAGGGGGGGGGADLCGAYNNVVRMDVPWGGVNDTRSNNTPFMANGVLVVRFTVPAGAAYGVGAVGAVTVSEFGDPPVYRQASLSTSACDFRGVATARGDRYVRDLTGATAFPLEWAVGNTVTASFTVTGSSIFYPQLQPGQTYYLSVRNWSPFNNGGQGGASCSRGTCNVIVHVSTP